MATYKIIGGDKKEYGPVTAEDVRLWIADGRLDEKSLVRGANDNDWRALSTFPEFTGAFTFKTVAPPTISLREHSTNFAERDYELDMGGCISRGWELLKNNTGVMFGSFLIMFIIEFAFSGALNQAVSIFVPKHLLAIALFKVIFNYFSSAASALVLGPLMGGLYLVYLKTIRGSHTKVGNVFAGFQKCFSQLFLGYLVVILITGLCMMPFKYIQAVKLDPLFAQLKNSPSADALNLLPQIGSAFISILPVLFICMIPMMYLSVNWWFTQPLIIDKQMDFWTAMKASWKMVGKHWWQVFGLVVLIGLLNVAGVLACGVGWLITNPIGFAAQMYAYETIFAES
ncbi:MAG TPA: glycerophosphoryl diester phosphodiesterase membrane domain-containing protein [Verrucomicrobiae bacterium]